MLFLLVYLLKVFRVFTVFTIFAQHIFSILLKNLTNILHFFKIKSHLYLLSKNMSMNLNDYRKNSCRKKQALYLKVLSYNQIKPISFRE